MKADVLGLPVIRSSEQETGVVGAAIAAAVGLGLYPDLGKAADAMIRVGKRFEPRQSFAGFYQERALIYRRVRDAALSLADASRAAPSKDSTAAA